jgi:hypothetical protein
MACNVQSIADGELSNFAAKRGNAYNPRAGRRIFNTKWQSKDAKYERINFCQHKHILRVVSNENRTKAKATATIL